MYARKRVCVITGVVYLYDPKNVAVPCYSGSSGCCVESNQFSDIPGIFRGLQSSTVVNRFIPSFVPSLNESLGTLITC